MSKSVVCFLAAVFVVGLWTAANVEPMSQVLDRCVHRKGCGFSETENGDVTGCSIKSKGGTGHCFYCNAQTQQCVQVGRVRGKWTRIPGDVLPALGTTPRRMSWW
jgi:hypothetical protein